MTAVNKLRFRDVGSLREDRIVELLSFCSQVDFGTVDLSEEEKEFRGELNQEMLSLCTYLPRSTRTKAALFLFEYLQASFIGELKFVNYFYAPAWSILFWLNRSYPDSRKLDPQENKDAKTGHTMAMFLHAFDDHLNDGQLPVTHLALLMRSQSWMIMSQAYERLAKGVENGAALVRGFIDDYYSSILKPDETQSLDSYCALFKKQMAICLVVPILMARKICRDEAYSRSIQSAYSSFGIAWRLIDDVQDIENDIVKGVHSSVYVCLNEDMRVLWNKYTEEKEENNEYSQAILSYVLEKKVIDKIMERAINELESAASIADSWNMPGLAGEFRCLMKPLRRG